MLSYPDNLDCKWKWICSERGLSGSDICGICIENKPFCFIASYLIGKDKPVLIRCCTAVEKFGREIGGDLGWMFARPMH